MRAEFVVDLQMIALGKEMQIDLAHDDSVGVGIAHHRRRVVPAGEVDAIVKIASHARQSGLEKTFAPEPSGGKGLLCLPREDDAHLLGVGPKDPNRQFIPEAMRTKYPEWIRVRAGQKNIQLIQRQASYLEGTHVGIANLKRLRRMSCADFFDDLL
jgi:hypothetical protein